MIPLYSVKESVAYSLGLTLGCVGTYAATCSEHGPWFLLTMPLAWLVTLVVVYAQLGRAHRVAAAPPSDARRVAVAPLDHGPYRSTTARFEEGQRCGRRHWSYFPLRCRCPSRGEGHHLVLTALGWRCRRPT